MKRLVEVANEEVSVDGGGDEAKVVSLLRLYMVEVYVARDGS
jgi:hypothetical protein